MTSNPFDIVSRFEDEMAAYAGAPFAVAVDTCTAALFLCCKYMKTHGWWNGPVTMPSLTFPGVACSVLHAGFEIDYDPRPWVGHYELVPLGVVDSALRLRRDMFWKIQRSAKKSYCCLSFQYRKHLPIGRGGMILTDDSIAVEWFKMARFFGRHEKPLMEDTPEFAGWHMYMEPERAAKGLTLMMTLPDYNPDLVFQYPDLSKFKAYQ